MSHLFSYPQSILIMLLILTLVAWSPKKIYFMWLLHKKLDSGQPLPKKLSDFPIHQTSLDDYSNIKEKIECFKNKVLRGEASEISLNSNEINTIYLQGISINKYKVNPFSSMHPLFMKYSNYYFYFEIVEDKIIKRMINYITPDGLDGIATRTDEIMFLNSNGSVLTKEEMVEWNTRNKKDINNNEFYSIKGSSFLPCLLRCSFESLNLKQLQSSENEIIFKIVNAITYINIVERTLKIKVDRISVFPLTEHS